MKSNVIYLSVGEGSGYSVSLFLGFSNFSEFRGYLSEFRRKYEKQLGEMISFLISSDEIVKQDYRDITQERIKKLEKEESKR